LRNLGLNRPKVSTQILQRDRHAEYLCVLALIAASIEQFATEIRNLQRTEIAEVEEPFRAGQRGSSAMPHKRNPIRSERLCGLARLVRSMVIPALENIPTWHERDLTNSSVERVILPDASILTDYILRQFAAIVRGLVVKPENMRANLEKTQGVVFSQRVMLALVKRVGRERTLTNWSNNALLRQYNRDDRLGPSLKADLKSAKPLALPNLTNCSTTATSSAMLTKSSDALGCKVG
jgi:adenylosuccinate lyase